MAKTRKEWLKEGLDHIWVEIFERKGNIIEVCKSIGIQDSPLDFNNVSQTTIENATYTDSNGDAVTLNGAEQGKIRAFQGFIKYRIACQKPIGKMDWKGLAVEEFDDFRSSVYCDPNESMCLRRGAEVELAAIATASAGAGTSAAATIPTPNKGDLFEFRKGIKRDPSMFPLLKDRKSWKTYKLSLESQAKAQRTSDILEPKFVPSSTVPDAVALFQEKQIYMYSVFVRTMKADFAKKALLD